MIPCYMKANSKWAELSKTKQSKKTKSPNYLSYLIILSNQLKTS